MALENARLYEDARKLADRDPLTGFYNHRFLHERLGEEVVRTQRGRRPLSVLMLDLDDFKLVNDTFGHLFGDRVLTWTAELIRSTLRASDIAGPLRRRRVRDHPAGDRRAMRRRRAAERILEAFRDHAFVGEQRGPVPIGASIGVATFPADGRTAHRAHRGSRQGPLPGQARRRPRRGARGRAAPPPDDAPRATSTKVPRDHDPLVLAAGDGREASGPPSSIPDVSQPHRSFGRSPETSERRTRRAWWIFAGSFFVLGLISVFRFAIDPSPTDVLVVALMVIIGFAAIRHRQAVTEVEIGRREEAESFARILSGLSRSVSPDAILDAIVAELADATGADHIVVARRRPDARVLQATLISARPGVADSTTILPIGDLEDAVEAGAEPGRREPDAIPLAVQAARPVPAGGVRGRLDDLTARARESKHHTSSGVTLNVCHPRDSAGYSLSSPVTSSAVPRICNRDWPPPGNSAGQ